VSSPFRGRENPAAPPARLRKDAQCWLQKLLFGCMFHPGRAGRSGDAAEHRLDHKGPLMSYFALLMDLEGRRVSVVGGGAVAERRVRALLECGAQLTVTAPEVTDGLRRLVDEGRLALRERVYRSGDFAGAALAFVAVDDREVSASAADDARSAGVPVNVADEPSLCDFIVPSVLRRGRLTVAVSTGGASPAWARKLRERLEGEFGEDYEKLLDTLAAVRRRCMETISDPVRRREALSALADDSLLELARGCTAEELESEMLRIIGLEPDDA